MSEEAKFDKFLCPDCGERSATTAWCEDCEQAHCAFCAGDDCFDDVVYEDEL